MATQQIRTRAERQAQGFYSEAENPGERLFRKLCGEVGMEPRRTGFQGRAIGGRDPVKMRAPDYETNRSWVEVKSILARGQDFVRIKLDGYWVAQEIYHQRSNELAGPVAKPVRYFFYDRPNERVTMVDLEVLRDVIFRTWQLPSVQLFDDHPEDENVFGWEVPTRALGYWRTPDEWVREMVCRREDRRRAA